MSQQFSMLCCIIKLHVLPSMRQHIRLPTWHSTFPAVLLLMHMFGKCCLQCYLHATFYPHVSVKHVLKLLPLRVTGANAFQCENGCCVHATYDTL